MEPEGSFGDGMQGASTFLKREENAMEFSAEASGLQKETHTIGMQECSTVAVR
jgi:hypothetical protein